MTRLKDKLKNNEVKPTIDALESPEPTQQFRKQLGELPLTPAKQPATYFQLQEEDLNNTRLMKSMYGKAVPDRPQQAIQYVLGLPTGLAPERRDYYSNKAAELEERRAEAQELYSKNKEWKGWLEVAEIIGQGLIQLGAAKAGQKYGFDSSKVKINPVDWDKRYTRMLKELDTQLKEVSRKEDVVERERSDEEKQFEDTRRTVAGNILKSAFIAEQERKAKAREMKKTGEKAKIPMEKVVDNKIKEVMKRQSDRMDAYNESFSVITDAANATGDIDRRAKVVEAQLTKLAGLGGLPSDTARILTDKFRETQDVSILEDLRELPISMQVREIPVDVVEAARAYLLGDYKPTEEAKNKILFQYGVDLDALRLN